MQIAVPFPTSARWGMMLSKVTLQGVRLARLRSGAQGGIGIAPFFRPKLRRWSSRPLKERYNSSESGLKKEIPSEVTADTYKHYGAK